MRDLHSTNLTFSSANGATCVNTTSNMLTCTVPSVPAAPTPTAITITFNVTSDPQACNDPASNIAAVYPGPNQIDGTTGNKISNNIVGNIQCPQVDADLSLTKTGPQNHTSGQPLTYTLTATNHSTTTTATKVTITDPVPHSSLTFNPSQSSQNCVLDMQTQDPYGTVICDGSITLAPGQSTHPHTITFDTVPQTLCNQPLTNKATVTALENDPDTQNNTDYHTIQSVTCSQQDTTLSLTKVADKLNVDAGDTFTYTFSVQNTGNVTANNVTVTDTLPTEVTYVSYTSANGTCTENLNTVTCTFPSINPSQSESATITVLASNNPNDCSSSFGNSATAEAQNAPQTTGSTQQNTTIDCGAPQFVDLFIEKTGLANINLGDQITYTLNVTNSGSTAASNVVVRDLLPASFVTYVSSTGNATCAPNGPFIDCALTSNLAPSATEQITLTFQSSSDSKYCLDTFTNFATTFASEQDHDTTDNYSALVPTTIQCQGPGTLVDLAITKSAPATVNTGSTLTYTLNVTNSGSTTATGVTITDAIPNTSELTFNAGASTAGCGVSGTDIVCSLSDIAPASPAQVVDIVFDVDEHGTCDLVLDNTAVVTHNVGDHDSSDNTSSTVQTQIKCPGAVQETTNLGVAKLVSSGSTFKDAVTLTGPQTVTYQVTLTSDNPVVTLQNVEITDAFVPVPGITQGAITNVLPATVTYNSTNNTFTITDTFSSSYVFTYDAPITGVGNATQVGVNTAEITGTGTVLDDLSNPAEAVESPRTDDA